MITEELIDAVAKDIPSFIGGKRLNHTYAVERECRALGSYFTVFPELMSGEEWYRLRVAALLHDITKEKKLEEQCALCEKYGIPLTDYERLTPKVLHAKTAPAVAREKYNAMFRCNLVDDGIADAIRTHTTGSANMSLMGKLLYLGDYIEDTRTYDDCIALRHAFYDTVDKVKDDAEKLTGHLNRVMLMSFDMTIKDLLENGQCIDPNTTAARNALLFSMKKKG